MKKITYLISMVALVLLTVSCNDDYTRTPEGSVSPAAPTFAAPAQSRIQIKTLENQVIPAYLMRLNWSKARFTYANGLPSDVSDLKYTLETDATGEFPSPVAIFTTDSLYADLHSEGLDELIKNFYQELPEQGNVDLFFRVKVSYSGGEPLYSNLISLNVQYVSTDTEVDNPTGEIQIKWKQVEGNWTQFAIYAWGDREFFGGWPGKVITPNANGWYSVVVPERRSIHLILNNNNGGNQFDFLTDPVESASYEIRTQDGNNTSTFTKVDNPADEVVIRWKYTGSDWTSFGIYAWGGAPTGETFGGWPGTIVTPNSEGWCSVTVPAGQTVGNVIFNNTTGGDGNQFDVKLNIISSVCFEITSNSYTVVDCP